MDSRSTLPGSSPSMSVSQPAVRVRDSAQRPADSCRRAHEAEGAACVLRPDRGGNAQDEHTEVWAAGEWLADLRDATKIQEAQWRLDLYGTR